MIPPKTYKSKRNITVRGRISTSSADSAPSWRFIPLTQGKFAIVDAEDYEWLNQFNWFAKERKYTWYAYRIVILGKCKSSSNLKRKRASIQLGRFILNPPKGFEVNYINRNELDNRKSNLRIATKSQVLANQRIKQHSSIYKGVIWEKWTSRWRAGITCERKFYNLGRFDDEIDAAKAYDAKALELFSEFAYTNF